MRKSQTQIPFRQRMHSTGSLVIVNKISRRKNVQRKEPIIITTISYHTQYPICALPPPRIPRVSQTQKCGCQGGDWNYLPAGRLQQPLFTEKPLDHKYFVYQIEVGQQCRTGTM
jgi:signal peptidase I